MTNDKKEYLETFLKPKIKNLRGWGYNKLADALAAELEKTEKEKDNDIT